MRPILLIGLGGFLGAICRYGASRLVQESRFVQERFGAGFPAGTLAVNISGCFLIGVLATLALEFDRISTETRLTLIVGFLGSFTTFSAFGYETLELLRVADWRRALFSVGAHLALGLLAVWCGAELVRRVMG